MSKNVSDQLVEMLVQAGVKRVYAITGDSLNPVNDAIRRDGRLEWIHVRHEESAAYAASMYPLVPRNQPLLAVSRLQ